MIKQSITFEDFEGNEVTEDHYFHLSKKEMIDMALDIEGDEGLGEYMERTVKSGDAREIIKMFELIISKSYGIRDPKNPVRFTKSEEISEDFMKSLAYDAFFSELLTNEQLAIDLINGMVPKDMAGQLKAIQGGENKDISLPETVDNETAEDARSGLEMPRDSEGNLLPWAFRKPNKRELQSMTREQLQDVMNRMSGGWTPVVNLPEALNEL